MSTATELETLGLPALRIESCDSSSCELLVDPIPRPRPESLTVSTRPAVDQVVLVDNGKPNSMAILRGAQALLRERGIDVAEEIPVKASAGIPLDEALLERLARERGLVLLGVND
jgi:nucleotide-binding universal stress UspA family protein